MKVIQSREKTDAQKLKVSTVSSSFDSWLEYFIIDHEINTEDVIFEGVVDQEMVRVTYREFFNAAAPYPYILKRIRNDLSVAAMTGMPIQVAAAKICDEDLIRNGHFSEKKQKGPSHFWEE